jgi:amino acid transporter
VVCSYVSELSRYFPHGVNGMLAGSATVFFAYIGFDTVASTAEEVRKVPSARDVCFLYKCHSFLPLLTPAGKESTERFAIGNWSCIGYLLCVVYGCFCCYCWAGAIFRHGSRYSYFICLCKAWNAMGYVSPVFLFTLFCIPVIGLQTLPSNFRYVVTSGAVLALCSTLMGSLLPQVC